MVLADTDAAKDAIASAELESRKITQGRNSILNPKETGIIKGDSTENQDQTTESAKEPLLPRAPSAEESGKQERFERHGYDGNSDTKASLPVEFYHYYHGSNTDMGTLIEVIIEFLYPHPHCWGHVHPKDKYKLIACSTMPWRKISIELVVMLSGNEQS